MKLSSNIRGDFSNYLVQDFSVENQLPTGSGVFHPTNPTEANALVSSRNPYTISQKDGLGFYNHYSLFFIEKTN